MHEAFRILFLIYFISHIPITLCVDLQALFGHHYPEGLRNLMEWYCSTYHDPLMRVPPIWFRSFIWCELLMQMPFFFFATFALLRRKNWIRIPGIVYGVHVSTTVIPILAEIVYNKAITDTEKLTLVGFYYPYLLIPTMFAVYLCLNPEPFGKTTKKQ